MSTLGDSDITYEQYRIQTTQVDCVHCRRPMLIPLKRDWSSPLYVMHMEGEHKMYKDILAKMHTDLIELAGECVEAGVRPSIMKRADEMNALFKELKQRFGIE